MSGSSDKSPSEAMHALAMTGMHALTYVKCTLSAAFLRFNPNAAALDEVKQSCRLREIRIPKALLRYPQATRPAACDWPPRRPLRHSVLSHHDQSAELQHSPDGVRRLRHPLLLLSSLDSRGCSQLLVSVEQLGR